MAANRNTRDNKGTKSAHRQEEKAKQEAEQRDAANRDRFVGETSLGAIPAQDLPDGGRGPVETNFGKEASRIPPQLSGGEIDESGQRGEGGARADRQFGGNHEVGQRKHN
jgi:hypothetical protein